MIAIDGQDDGGLVFLDHAVDARFAVAADDVVLAQPHPRVAIDLAAGNRGDGGPGTRPIHLRIWLRIPVGIFCSHRNSVPRVLSVSRSISLSAASWMAFFRGGKSAEETTARAGM